MSKKKEVTFKDLSRPCRVGVATGIALAVVWTLTFSMGFIQGWFGL